MRAAGARAWQKAPRASVGVAVLDGKLHAIGGRAPDGKTVAAHEVYDPETDTWSDAAPLPQARDHMAVVTAEGKIHAIGGRITSPLAEPVSLHDVYDALATVERRAATADRAQRVSSTFYRGLIMVLGGEFPPQDRTFNENEGFEVKTNTWRTLAPLPAGRHATAATTDGKNVYLAGGSPQAGVGAGDRSADRLQPAVRLLALQIHVLSTPDLFNSSDRRLRA